MEVNPTDLQSAASTPESVQQPSQRIEEFVRSPDFKIGNPRYMAVADTIELRRLRVDLDDRVANIQEVRNRGDEVQSSSQQAYDTLIAREAAIYALVHERALC